MNLKAILIILVLVQVLKSQSNPDPNPFSWADYNGISYIGSVKNQNFPAVCNSGWAFASVDVFNSRIKIRRKAASPDISISVQVLLSCDTFDFGCLGGQPLTAYSWMQKKNITDQSCHSYTATGYTNGYGCSSVAKCQQCKQSVCKSMPNSKIYSVFDYGTISGVEQIQKEVSSWGPIACGINSDALHNYTSGIIRSPSDNQRIDHFVTLYGWNVEDGVYYWKLKNSWGPGWGENGHFRVQMGKNLLGLEHRCYWGSPVDTWTQDIRNNTLPNADASLLKIINQQPLSITLPKYLVSSRSYQTPQSCQSSAAFSIIMMLADRQSMLNSKQSTILLSAQTLLNCGVYKCSKQANPSDILAFLQKYGLPEEGCQTYQGKNPQKQNCDAISNCGTCSGTTFNFKCNAVQGYKRWRIKEHGVASGVYSMKNQLVSGPIVCGIQLTKSFQNYKSGIFSEISISPKVDHYVQIISWGTQNNKQFWLGRNHWGTAWGDSSFFRIQAGKNTLGIESKCYYAKSIY